ncbi:MAG: hypothetical protein ACREDY_07160, partial [Bradyrhizobium sp.]
MEPTADGLAEIAHEFDAPPPTVDHSAAEPAGNGHDAAAYGEPGFDPRQMLHALQAVRFGDFSVRLPSDLTGLSGKIADAFNDIVAANERMAQQLEHVGQVVGREGKTRQRVQFALAHGAWGEMEGSVNT